MNTALYYKYKQAAGRRLADFIIPSVTIVLMLVMLHDYFRWQSVNFIIGLLALPVVARVRKGNYSYRYGIAALAVATLAVWMPVNTLLYFTFVLLLFFIAESRFGKTDNLLLLVVLLLSPVFQYAVNIFSFPLRLFLTQWATRIIRLFNGGDVMAEGNIILYRDMSFSVDPACMGLNMLSLSLIISLLFAGHFRKKFNKTLNWKPVMLLLLFVVLLNTGTNLLRIVCMVQFTILPGTVSHDAVGLLLFLVYVIIPVYVVVPWGVKRFGKPFMEISSAAAWPSAGKNILLVFTGLLLLAACCRNLDAERSWARTLPVTTVNGYTVQPMEQEVLKLDNGRSLVYLKKITAFYRADHTPYICWQGSGYSFSQVNEEEIAGMPVCRGRLESAAGTLYTAWWYDNGELQTTSQWTWRWKMLTGGRPFYVVNITASTPGDLEKEIAAVVRNKPFSPLTVGH